LLDLELQDLLAAIGCVHLELCANHGIALTDGTQLIGELFGRSAGWLLFRGGHDGDKKRTDSDGGAGKGESGS
jgi:hypothetical protein